MPVRPHSFADCATFSACACSSSALVGMQPQIRQVPPSVFCFSTTATLRPSCAARIAATYPPVPAPITTTSYSLATISHCLPDRNSPSSRRHEPLVMDDKGTKVCLGSGAAGAGGIDLRLELTVIELQLPVHLGDVRELAAPCGAHAPAPRARRQAPTRATIHKPPSANSNFTTCTIKLLNFKLPPRCRRTQDRSRNRLPG